MNGNTVKDKLDDLVDVLDRLLKETTRIAESLGILEDLVDYGVLGGKEHPYLHIRIESDDPLAVELMPTEED